MSLFNSSQESSSCYLHDEHLLSISHPSKLNSKLFQVLDALRNPHIRTVVWKLDKTPNKTLLNPHTPVCSHPFAIGTASPGFTLSVCYLPPTINDTAERLYAALPVWQPIRLTHADRYRFIRKDLKIPKVMWEFIKSSAVMSREPLLSVSLIYSKNFQSSQNLRAFSILMLTDS